MKPIHAAGIIALIATACIVGYVFTADTIFAPQEEDYRVGLILDIDNAFDSFTMQIAEGVYLLSSVDGVETYPYVEKTDANVIAYANDLAHVYDVDILVTAGYNIADQMTTFAAENPDLDVLSVDTDYAALGQPENVANIIFRSNEPSFVAGYVAGMTTRTNVIGFIGGVENDILIPFEKGFERGINLAEKERGVDITFLSAYIGSFNDISKGSELAADMYNQNADIIYQAAGAAGHGVITTADELHRYVIGVDVDQSYIAEQAVIFSVVKYIPEAIYDTVLKYKDGENFGGKTISLGYSDGHYVGLSGFMDGVIEESVIEKAKKIEADIAAGKIAV